VRAILGEPPPEEIRADLRYRLGGRFYWIGASGVVNPGSGKEDPFVLVKSPRAFTTKAYHAALRDIRRQVRSSGGDVDIYIVEPIEPEMAVGYVNDKGFRLFAFDEAGAVTSWERIDVPPEEAASLLPGP
jgi:hypothetical protein